MTSRQELSPWDRAAPRAYITLALCFPLDSSADEETHKAIFEHTKQSLARLAEKRPDFASRMVREDKSIFIHENASNEIPFDVLKKNDVHFPYTYEELERDGFPACAFVNPALSVAADPLDGGNRVPVSQVRLLFIEGGFVLLAYVHHAFADGRCVDAFLQLLGAATRGADDVPLEVTRKTGRSLDLGLPEEEGEKQEDATQLLARCPEYKLLSKPVGPTAFDFSQQAEWEATPKTGKTFVIDLNKLDELRKSTTVTSGGGGGKPPSQFTFLAALAWAHTTKARLAADPESDDKSQPVFRNPQDWSNPRKGLFAGNASLQTYFGNAVTMPITKLPTIRSGADLVSACDRASRIIDIANAITAANRAVDETFVLARTALFTAMGDDLSPLGIAMEPWVPHAFSMNTWEFKGRSARFWFPGVAASSVEGENLGWRPDALRRVQGVWSNAPHALIAPSRIGVGKDEQELIVTLPAGAMEVLERDAGWMGLVKRVIG